MLGEVGLKEDSGLPQSNDSRVLGRRFSWLVSAIMFPNNPDILTDLMSKLRASGDDRRL